MNERNPASEAPRCKVTSRQLDAYVDAGLGSYDDAFRHFRVTPEEVDDSEDYATPEAIHLSADMEGDAFDVEPVGSVSTTALDTLRSIEPGPSLSLLARAKALDIIMKQFNQENKSWGAHFSRDYNGMDTRYGSDTDRVLDNMSAIAGRMGGEAMRAIFTLARGDSGGLMPADADYSGSIESSLRREYGPGNADARKRDKLITKVYRTAGTTKSKYR